LAMICLTTNVYAQGKKGKGRDYPPSGGYYPPSKEGYYQQSVGFRGPSQPIGSLLVTKSGQVQATPAASAKSLTYDTPVMLVGRIIRSIGQDLYTFKDASGEVTVRIKYGDWKGLSIEEADDIVIAGYVKYRVEGQVEIDVRMLSKTKT